MVEDEADCLRIALIEDISLVLHSDLDSRKSNPC